LERFFYRMKPIMLEAVQLDGRNVQDVLRLCGVDNVEIVWSGESNSYTQVKVLSSKFLNEFHTAEIGDWLVPGTAGEIYILKDKTFNSYFQYEKVMHMF